MRNISTKVSPHSNLDAVAIEEHIQSAMDNNDPAIIGKSEAEEYMEKKKEEYIKAMREFICEGCERYTTL